MPGRTGGSNCLHCHHRAFRNLTPGPSSFSSTKTTPADFERGANGGLIRNSHAKRAIVPFRAAHGRNPDPCLYGQVLRAPTQQCPRSPKLGSSDMRHIV